MSNFSWRKGQRRGPNLVEAHPERMESKDGKRWACGRYIKRSIGNHRYDAVQSWTLKERVNGKAVTRGSRRNTEAALAWVENGKI